MEREYLLNLLVNFSVGEIKAKIEDEIIHKNYLDFLISKLLHNDFELIDIFGDPVNTASRLESSSQTMRIHVSETTYKLVKDKFNFEEQAPLEVKGKGKMKMYFVKST